MKREELEEFHVSGKTYDLWDGSEYRIYAFERGYMHGAYRNKHTDGYWIPHTLRIESHDILSVHLSRPVVDWPAMPKWAKAVVKNKDESWRWFTVKEVVPVADFIWELGNKVSSIFSSEYKDSGLIPPAYAPKWEGDWKDSLVLRPEGE